jgi:cation transport regulator ChaC
MAGVWYFAYGSNMSTSTFRGRRGIEFGRALAARAPGWRLVLDKPGVVPVGESFANLVPAPDGEAFGVLYEISEDDLAHVDLTEGVLIDNYQRIAIAVHPLAVPANEVVAFTLVSDRHDESLQPSERYMACLIAGAEEHGLPARYVEFLRGVQARPTSAEAAQWQPVVDEVLRRRSPEVKR